jgi:transposase
VRVDQSTLFPEGLDEYIAADKSVRVVDAFVEQLDLKQLGFKGVEPVATGRPSYHPGTLLKIYIYGYLNRLQSSRRLERETQRNVELIWLTGRLSPDFMTIADFRKENGAASGMLPMCQSQEARSSSRPATVRKIVLVANAKPNQSLSTLSDISGVVI